ncbi:hypothetical protein BKA62DRAFT_670996 [Auriculariales sp. MPI-PUGE-AT-0066]|nr:hypothetical protein BKA62DRAFT_670996 [Auriculariales sp. MPI-PUGE-AT-0066]
MSSFINKFKSKMAERRRSKEIQKTSAPATAGGASSTSGSSEPTFSIQPHPAKTNDPADLARGQPIDGMPGGGLQSGGYPQVAPYNAKGPFVPSQQIQDNMPPPQTREELRARSAELNQ